METTFVSGLVGIGLIFLATAVFWVGVQLQRIRTDLRRALSPTMKERIARVVEQTRANAALVGETRGREVFFDYTLSEAAIIDFAEEVERKVQENPGIQVELLRQQFAQDERSLLQRGKDYLVRNKGKIAEKVFGKLNDLVKGMIPGSRSGSGGAE